MEYEALQKNYRSISITPVISKIMESIVRDAIVAHMMKHNLLSDHQHGFVPWERLHYSVVTLYGRLDQHD